MSESKQVALVTGASRGIGRSIALTLAEKGFTVIGTATSESGAQGITEALQPLGGRGVRAAMFERLKRRRCKPQFIERGLFIARPCERQVPVVHRIEAAAENAEKHWERTRG